MEKRLTMATDLPPVLFETRVTASDHLVGVVTMNAPSTLNSLSLEMIDSMAGQLAAWRDDNSVAALFVQAAGDRAFCAGGDIQRLYESMRTAPAGPNEYAMAFFSREYRLNYLIHCYPKPILAWGHGIVMGGGLGILGGCSHRVGTESTRIALPEITIGLFPDAGASWYLTHMDPDFARFIALTGCQLTAKDGIRSNLLDYLVPNASREMTLELLESTVWTGTESDRDIMSQLCASIVDEERFGPGKLDAFEEDIRLVFGAAPGGDEQIDLATIAARLELENDGDNWFVKAGAAFLAGCPTTAHLVLEQVRRASSMTLKEMFQQELCMAMQCAFHPDFVEGVRALLIEKDRNPRWQWGRCADVPRDYVLAHFEPAWTGVHPLADLAS